MNIKTPKILQNLNFLPKITNITVDSTNIDSTSITSNFQINVKYTDKKFTWFLDPKVLKILNLVITYSFDKSITNELLTDNKSFIYKKIESKIYPKNKFVQIIDKFNNINSNSSKTIDPSGQVFITTSFQKLLKLNKKPQHLTIFVAVSLDKSEMAKTFNINESLLETVGIYSSEQFIDDSRYTSDKINDLTIFREKDKFQFNSKQFSKFLQDITLIEKTLQKQLKEINFSPLYHSINKDMQVNCVFFINLEKLFQYKSKFPAFFQNAEFNSNFFATESNYLPIHVKLVRYDKSDKYETLYDGNFSKFISDSKVKMSNIDLGESKVLCLSFLDKQSNKLFEQYQYEIELSFNDRTMFFLESIQLFIEKELKNIEEIINIAKYKNYYQISTNCFSPKLEQHLNKNNLSIKNSITNTSKILSQFKQFDEKIIKSIVSLATSTYFNFDVLYSILDVLIFLKLQIKNIQNNITVSNSNKITISNKFLQKIDLSNSNLCRLEVVPADNLQSISSISSSDFKNRVQKEISKYYNINNIVHISKNTIMTPRAIYGKYIDILQEDVSMDTVDFKKYNNFLIDYYYQNIFAGDFKSESNIYKLKNILQNYGFDISEIEIDDQIELEDLLLNTFLRCVVIQDFTEFEYKNVDSKSIETKVSLIQLEKISVAMRSMISSLSNDSSLLKINELNSRDNLTDIKKTFAMYMNYKNTFKIQFFDIKDFQWKDFDSANFVNNKNFICRYISYFDENADINQKKDIDFKLIDEIFLLLNDKTSESIDRKLLLQIIPNSENLYCGFSFGSRVYGNYSDLSDYDFILIYNNIQPIQQVVNDKYTFNITTKEMFQKDLNEHKPYALECFFLDSQKVLLNPAKNFNFSLNYEKLRSAFEQKADNEFLLFRERFNSGDFIRGKKCLFHSIRILLFGLQIKKYGKIIDYSQANFIWENIKSSNNLHYGYYESKYFPIFHTLKKQMSSEKLDLDISQIYKMLN